MNKTYDYILGGIEDTKEESTEKNHCYCDRLVCSSLFFVNLADHWTNTSE
jgi:hypothetical protein